MRRSTLNATRTATLALMAGSALTLTPALAIAQPARTGEHQPAKMNQNPKQTTNAFYKSSTLIGSSIHNQSGETIGEVKDLIVDRGSGQIRYIVLSNGGFLGIGDKEVALPFSKMSFDHVKEQFQLNYTQEMIDSAEEFKPGDWVQLDSPTWDEQFLDMFRSDSDDSAKDADEYTGKLADAEKVEVSGVVRSIDRDRKIDGDEQVTVTIDQNGESRTVVLGPSWYVMSRAKVPMRGDQLVVSGFTLGEDGQGRVIARTVSIDGADFVLRDADGAPRWTTYSDNSSEARADKVDDSLAPLILLTDITGMDATAHGEDSGDIAGAVVEVNSGRIGMLILDPDENLLGMGDTLRCVPWPIVAIGEDAVRIDADKSMLRSSQAIPDDVSVFDNRTQLARVYRVFSLDPSEFKAPAGRDYSRVPDHGG